MNEERNSRVILQSVEGRHIAVAKAIREVRRDLSPKAAKDITQILPQEIAAGLDYATAKWLVDMVRSAGGTCIIDPPMVIPEPIQVNFQSWLIAKVTPEEVEANDSDWDPVKAQMMPGDEIWLFRSPSIFWEKMCGREGYALLRKGEVIETIVTAMN